MKPNTSFKLLYNQLWLVDNEKIQKINPVLIVKQNIPNGDKMREPVAILITDKTQAQIHQAQTRIPEPSIFEKKREVPAILNNDALNIKIDYPITNWDILIKNVSECTKCPLSDGRKHAVIERGNRNAKWMFIGEAPSESENQSGIAFSGEAGELLNKMIAAMNLNIDTDAYICHVVKCKPPVNRNPESSEIETCRGYLLSQIELVKPQIIVTLGMFASTTILKTNLAINNLRGKVYSFKEIPVIVTYDPAYLLRNTDAKKYAWKDLQLAMKVLENNENKN